MTERRPAPGWYTWKIYPDRNSASYKMKSYGRRHETAVTVAFLLIILCVALFVF